MYAQQTVTLKVSKLTKIQWALFNQESTPRIIFDTGPLHKNNSVNAYVFFYCYHIIIVLEN
jgi:hypothetical protein